MEVVQVLHMNKGDGETSYARNSTLQTKSISIAKLIIEKAVLELLGSNIMGIESMGIADLGCSVGPNSLQLISHIMDLIVHNKLSKVTELRVSLNDLFSNDFNSIFTSLPSFYNKLQQDHDKHYIHDTPLDFCCARFILRSIVSQKDFRKTLSFLRSRAEELVEGGRMVLSFLGRRSSDLRADQGNSYPLELFAQALIAMVSKGLIEEEKVNSFNIPYYTACPEELNLVLEKEGSFIKNQIEAFNVDWEISEEDLNQNLPNSAFGDDQTITKSGLRLTNAIRAVAESMFESHFGKQIVDDVFQKHAELVSKYC